MGKFGVYVVHTRYLSFPVSFLPVFHCLLTFHDWFRPPCSPSSPVSADTRSYSLYSLSIRHQATRLPDFRPRFVVRFVMVVARVLASPCVRWFGHRSRRRASCGLPIARVVVLA